VIALSDWRYSDPRTDGLVYLYLPVKTPASLVERAIENAADHIHLLATRRDVNQRLAGTTREIQEISAIGAAFAAEHDVEKLLPMVLQKCREITNADPGLLYLVEGPSSETHENATRVLVSKLAQNDSVTFPFRETVRDISDKSVVGHVAATGETLNVEDAYHLPDGAPYGFNRKFDEETGYRTKSILAVPMRNVRGETLGVVQLINAKRSPDAKLTSVKAVAAETVAFSRRLQDIVASLANQAAVALDNARLFASIRQRN
jgi:GAF domain-containing protein